MQLQRTILWVVFSMSLLFLWDSWQRHNGKPSLLSGQPAAEAPAGKGKTDAPAGATAAPGAVPSAPAAASVPGGAPVAASAQSAPAATAGSPAAELITLSSDTLQLKVDPVGGQVRRAVLLRHKAGSETLTPNEGHVVLLQDDPGRVYVAQSGLVGAPAGSSFPTHRSVFSVAEGARSLQGDAKSVELKLTAESGGVRLTRTYRLDRGSYVVAVRDEVTNLGEAPVKPTLYMQLTRNAEFTSEADLKAKSNSAFAMFTGGAVTYSGPVVYTDEKKFQKVDFGDIEKKKTDLAKNAVDGWVGMIQHYFVSAWLPTDKAGREYYGNRVDNNLYAIGALQPLAEIAPKASLATDTRLLIGPQDQRMLETVAPGLDLSVDYGWLTPVAKPIFWLLEMCHRLVGNWGWAIVLLTIIIKTLFFPLQAASYKSMARMKAVTPRMMQIRERHANDRAKMNQAMMELYQQEKINPLGGCLPIVVQIPVFIALYWVLLASVEMRNAPWIGWIHDLAVPDPWFILPAVMAGTMFIQVKLNPTPPDPVQAKVMMAMPLIFSVMFFFFPAGLVLYWLVNNVYSIAQQWYITRAIEKAAAAKKA
ncbi:MAG: membrane protein insertase YidC [Betaproteobacteria bacterium]|nr:membrane protein insertase YidC [Betaproteobacteria bacterium]